VANRIIKNTPRGSVHRLSETSHIGTERVPSEICGVALPAGDGLRPYQNDLAAKAIGLADNEDISVRGLSLLVPASSIIRVVRHALTIAKQDLTAQSSL